MAHQVIALPAGTTFMSHDRDHDGEPTTRLAPVFAAVFTEAGTLARVVDELGRQYTVGLATNGADGRLFLPGDR